MLSILKFVLCILLLFIQSLVKSDNEVEILKALTLALEQDNAQPEERSLNKKIDTNSTSNPETFKFLRELASDIDKRFSQGIETIKKPGKIIIEVIRTFLDKTPGMMKNFCDVACKKPSKPLLEKKSSVIA